MSTDRFQCPCAHHWIIEHGPYGVQALCKCGWESGQYRSFGSVAKEDWDIHVQEVAPFYFTVPATFHPGNLPYVGQAITVNGEYRVVTEIEKLAGGWTVVITDRHPSDSTGDPFYHFTIGGPEIGLRIDYPKPEVVTP